MRSSPSTSVLSSPGNLLVICKILPVVHIPPILCSYVGAVERAAHEARAQPAGDPAVKSVTFLLFLTKDPLCFLNSSEPVEKQHGEWLDTSLHSLEPFVCPQPVHLQRCECTDNLTAFSEEVRVS